MKFPSPSNKILKHPGIPPLIITPRLTQRFHVFSCFSCCSCTCLTSPQNRAAVSVQSRQLPSSVPLFSKVLTRFSNRQVILRHLFANPNPCQTSPSISHKVKLLHLTNFHPTPLCSTSTCTNSHMKAVLGHPAQQSAWRQDHTALRTAPKTTLGFAQR